jgi:hypothetical protein
MMKVEDIKQTINSLDKYTGSKWNLFAIYSYLKDSYNRRTYNPYCPVCDSCGEDGCCPATRCSFGKGCLYPESNLDSLHFGYYNAIDFYRLIQDSGNQELMDKADAIYDHNYDIVYGK